MNKQKILSVTRKCAAVMVVFAVILGVIAPHATQGSQALQGNNSPTTCASVPINPDAFTLIYGYVTLNGSPASVGTQVEARNPRGELVLCLVLDSVGLYALAYIYGEQAGVSTGMREGETMNWFINGYAAQASPNLAWTKDKDIHQVDLTASSLATVTATATNTSTPTHTNTPTPTSSTTPTPSATPTPTNTPSPSPTSLPSATPTVTLTPTPTLCNVPLSPKFMFVYGSVTADNVPAAVGSVITVVSSRGNIVGCAVVSVTGNYGLMPIYGEDTNVSPIVPGLREGETLSFYINGDPAWASPNISWSDSKNVYEVNLNRTYSQSISLNSGWQLISYYVEPVLPPIESAFASIAGQFCRVTDGSRLWDCRVPSQFRTLTETHHNIAYWLFITATTPSPLIIQGLPLNPYEGISLQPGWNYVGYTRPGSMPLNTALQSISGKYQRVFDGIRLYDANIPPQFNTLSQLQPGRGYLIYMTQPAMLLYPNASNTLAKSTKSDLAFDKKTENSCIQNVISPSAMFLYGSITNSTLLKDQRVEAITPRGEIAGCLEVGGAKEYGMMVVYGNYLNSGSGYLKGEEIVLRIGGDLIKTGLVFQGDLSLSKFDVINSIKTED